VALAGRAGSVTVATNMAGRGTDIRPDPVSIAAGGLHVIGAERHESRRIDNQLAGRAARAGDPGSCQFFLSADDELISHHAPRLAMQMRLTADRNGESHHNISSAVRRLQATCEKQAFESRRLMMQQDRDIHDLMRSLCGRTGS